MWILHYCESEQGGGEFLLWRLPPQETEYILLCVWNKMRFPNSPASTSASSSPSSSSSSSRRWWIVLMSTLFPLTRTWEKSSLTGEFFFSLFFWWQRRSWCYYFMEDINGSEMSAIPVKEPTVVVDAAPGSEVIMARGGNRTPERLAVDGREQPSGGTIGDASGSAAMSTAVEKRKRGRPKKTEMPAISASLFSGAAALQPPKRGRGRPRGSGKLQLLPCPGEFSPSSPGLSLWIRGITVALPSNIIDPSFLINFLQNIRQATELEVRYDSLFIKILFFFKSWRILQWWGESISFDWTVLLDVPMTYLIRLAMILFL